MEFLHAPPIQGGARPSGMPSDFNLDVRLALLGSLVLEVTQVVGGIAACIGLLSLVFGLAC